MVAESNPEIDGSKSETPLASVHPIAPAGVDVVDAPDVPVSGDIAALLAGVRERGFVTTGEIFAALPDLEPETAELAAIYANIRASRRRRSSTRSSRSSSAKTNVAPAAVAPTLHPHRSRPHRSRPVLPPAAEGPTAAATPTLSAGTLAARRSRAAERLDRAPMETGSFDPVRMYLKEIGKVPLLTGRAGSHAREADRGRPRAPATASTPRRALSDERALRPRRRSQPTVSWPSASSPRRTSGSSCRSRSATSVGAWRCST